jgi:hypothetical protein
VPLLEQLRFRRHCIQQALQLAADLAAVAGVEELSAMRPPLDRYGRAHAEVQTLVAAQHGAVAARRAQLLCGLQGEMAALEAAGDIGGILARLPYFDAQLGPAGEVGAPRAAHSLICHRGRLLNRAVPGGGGARPAAAAGARAGPPPPGRHQMTVPHGGRGG